MIDRELEKNEDVRESESEEDQTGDAQKGSEPIESSVGAWVYAFGLLAIAIRTVGTQVRERY